MKLHTVFITHNRLELSKRALDSYFNTVTVPHSVVISDNASSDGTQEWISDLFRDQIIMGYNQLKQNRYPGVACNQGWSMAPDDATHLHRADNDFEFLPGWCDEVAKAFRRRSKKGPIGQVGLRTGAEEDFVINNVGGNNVIRRELWDQGLRYDERPWPEYPPGWSEDGFFSPAVREMGYMWVRVKHQCIAPLGSGDWNDPYYQKSFGDRHIERPE